ncbi:MAG: (2Fe-2S)-binding protein, partial [Bacteroidales bacterium]|nr:(2Fe-2S)-binding protein [Bacteroidales bacterium]
MYKITSHPILDIPEQEIVEFLFEGKKIKAAKGYTIAAALHQAGHPVHSLAHPPGCLRVFPFRQQRL